MSGATSIQWTDATWNPTRGCDKISPGCKHCYAETFAERWRGVPGHPYEQGFDLRLVPEKLDEPLHWKKPRRIFVNSMSDLFHEGIPDKFIGSVFGRMRLAHWHTFQALTKRGSRLREWVSREMPEPLPNVWLGVSVEDRQYGVPRLAELQATPAAVRFVSFEPLLEDLGTVDLRGIGWAIIGGESGGGARPFRPEWARNLVEQCRAADVAVFVKQFGANIEWDGHSPPGCPWPIGTRTADTGRGCFSVSLRDRKHGGEPEEWPADLRLREFPPEAAP